MPDQGYYKTLQVPRDAPQEDIRRAFRKLAAKYHPDRNPGDKAAEKKFKELAEAFSVLDDPKSRKTYDHGGVEQVRSDPGFRGFDSTEEVFTRFGDIFGDLFGERVHRQDAAAAGEDLHAEIRVPFDMAASGGKTTIRLDGGSACAACGGTGAEGGRVVACPKCRGRGVVSNRANQAHGFFSVSTPCPDCRGTGTRATSPCRACGGRGVDPKPRVIDVTIPQAIDDGTTLRLRGVGEPGHRGGPPGDLLIRVRVDPHPVFERDGLDLKTRAKVDVSTAALGGKVTVPLLKGQADMKVPPGTQPGQILRLAGQGLVNGKGSKGDLLVNVEVEVPRNLSERRRKLLEDFRAAD
jgi:molecular chaperone DnaJ